MNFRPDDRGVDERGSWVSELLELAFGLGPLARLSLFSGVATDKTLSLNVPDDENAAMEVVARTPQDDRLGVEGGDFPLSPRAKSPGAPSRS